MCNNGAKLETELGQQLFCSQAMPPLADGFPVYPWNFVCIYHDNGCGVAKFEKQTNRHL